MLPQKARSANEPFATRNFPPRRFRPFPPTQTVPDRDGRHTKPERSGRPRLQPATNRCRPTNASDPAPCKPAGERAAPRDGPSSAHRPPPPTGSDRTVPGDPARRGRIAADRGPRHREAASARPVRRRTLPPRTHPPLSPEHLPAMYPFVRRREAPPFGKAGTQHPDERSGHGRHASGKILPPLSKKVVPPQTAQDSDRTSCHRHESLHSDMSVRVICRRETRDGESNHRK